MAGLIKTERFRLQQKDALGFIILRGILYEI